MITPGVRPTAPGSSSGVPSPPVIMVELAGRGGICHYTYGLSNALSAHRPVIVLSGAPYDLAGRARSFEVWPTFRRFRTSPWRVVRHLRRALALGPCAVHCQVSQFPAVMWCLIRLVRWWCRVPIVVTAHNVVAHDARAGDAWIRRRMYRLCDALIVHSEADRALLAPLVPERAESVHVIPHGHYGFFHDGDQPAGMAPSFVDAKPHASPECGGMASNSPAADSSAARSRCGADMRVLFFGYIRPYKGLHDLLDAWPTVLAKVPEARLVIAGEPRESLDPYRARAEAAGVAHSMTWHARYVSPEEVRRLVLDADLVALPYREASQSGVLLLALALGRPVVATRVGGIPEVLEDGVQGLLVPPADPPALAEALVRLLSDPVARAQMGRAASEHVRARFGWEAIARATDAMYVSLQPQTEATA